MAAKFVGRLLQYLAFCALLSTMKFVEPDLPPWADEITVEQEGDALYVCGTNRIRKPQVATDQERSSWDLLRQYRAFQWRKDEPKQTPHMRFANASDEDKLRAFTRRYGPVAGIDPVYKRSGQNRETICVLESVTGLKREQQLFSAAVRLSIELKRNQADLKTLASVVADMAAIWTQPGPSWENPAEGAVLPEHPVRHGIRVEARAGWFWKLASWKPFADFASTEGAQGEVTMDTWLRGVHSPRLKDFGLDVLLLLLNQFLPTLERFDGNVAELPRYDRTGIRGVLYWMLRYDVLRGLGTQICQNSQCGQFFVVERSGQIFCCQECSRRERQREYWREAGRALRKNRTTKHVKRKKG